MVQRRNTRQRQLVFESVLAQNHASADQIYISVREKDDKISRGTVYRNLKLLVESGEIKQVEMPDVDRYDWRLDQHYHIVCTECGKISDVPISYEKDLDREVEIKTGYNIDKHKTVFEGICPDCKNKNSTNK